MRSSLLMMVLTIAAAAAGSAGAAPPAGAGSAPPLIKRLSLRERLPLVRCLLRDRFLARVWNVLILLVLRETRDRRDLRVLLERVLERLTVLGIIVEGRKYYTLN